MTKKITLVLLCAILLSSCVTRRLYNELEGQYESTLNEKNLLENTLDLTKGNLDDLKSEKIKLASQLTQLQEERNNLNAEILQKTGTLDKLQSSFSDLEIYSEVALKREADRLEKAKAELEERSRRVEELEVKIAAQDKQMTSLKNTLSGALNSFEGKGLTIEHKNGKVYVSMENKLLFNSGSWLISSDGKKAIVELGKVLGKNPDISVLIEGHTDNDKISRSLGGGVQTNWDLSTKRATSIVEILAENPNIDAKNLTAAGRSEYAPIASNSTPEGKAKNRRIEVILAPKLDEISEMLNAL